MLLYAITDRRLFAKNEIQPRESLIGLARKLSRGGVDYFQIREKDISDRDLLDLTIQIVEAVREECAGRDDVMKVLLNGSPEIAFEAGADGIHLPGCSHPESRAKAIAAVHKAYAGSGCDPVISHSCHTVEEAAQARGVSILLFAPVFEKRVHAGSSPDSGADFLPGQGLARLTEACRAAGGAPVLALGGVTAQNAAACIQAGAAGVAAVRLFLGEEWRQLWQAPR